MPSRRRVEGIKKLAEGKFDPSVIVGFTRHNAAVIICGRAGANGSIKGIGFIHRENLLPETLRKLREELKRPYSSREVLSFLLNEIYVREKIDFTKLVSLELAKKHTWTNVTGEAGRRRYYSSRPRARPTSSGARLKYTRTMRFGSTPTRFMIHSTGPRSLGIGRKRPLTSSKSRKSTTTAGGLWG